MSPTSANHRSELRRLVPKPIRRMIWHIYRMRPTAVAFRRGVADRQRVAAEVHKRCNGVVRRGPFAGMIFPFITPDSGSKCLGSYERELHGLIEQLISRRYSRIVNIGCAEGYYAVGLANRMLDTTVFAFDTNRDAIEQCRVLATANGLPADHIQFGSEVTHGVLDALCTVGTLVLADIEGAEQALFDPTLCPGLVRAAILVELHDFLVPGIEEVIRERFLPTHHITAIDSEPRENINDYPEIGGLPTADQRTAIFERWIPQRWLMMTPSRSSWSPGQNFDATV